MVNIDWKLSSNVFKRVSIHTYHRVPQRYNWGQSTVKLNIFRTRNGDMELKSLLTPLLSPPKKQIIIEPTESKLDDDLYYYYIPFRCRFCRFIFALNIIIVIDKRICKKAETCFILIEINCKWLYIFKIPIQLFRLSKQKLIIKFLRLFKILSLL